MAFALFVCLTFAIYAPALTGPKLWDDEWLVAANPFFRSPLFVGEVFRHSLYFESPTRYYRPTQNLSYLADYLLWGDGAFGFHCSNIVLHAIAGFLLWRLLRQLIPPLSRRAGSRGLAPPTATNNAGDLLPLAVALLWTAHPVHTPAVAYISGRADPLAAVCALGGWLAFIRACQSDRRWSAAAAWVAAATLGFLALGAKEIALVWFAIFGAWLFIARQFRWRLRLGTAGACAVIIGAWALLRHFADAAVPPAPPPARPAIAETALLSLRALGDYVSLLVWPANLHMERVLLAASERLPGAPWPPLAAGDTLALIGLATLLAASWAAVAKDVGTNLRRAGVVCFAAGFLPVSNLFPLNAQAAEHWLYIPAVGFLLTGAGIALALPPTVRRALPICCGIALLLLGLRTWYRAADWSDPERFFRAQIAAGGGSVRAYANFADVLVARGRPAAAEAVLREALARWPGFPATRIQLGRLLQQSGRATAAATLLEPSPGPATAAAADYAGTWRVPTQLARVVLAAGDPERALAIIGPVATANPAVWPVVATRIGALIDLRRPADAVAAAADFTRGHWWHYEARLTLARLLNAGGDTAGAAAALRQARWLDVRAAEPWYLLALLELDRGRPEQALPLARAALARDRRKPEHHGLLAVILHQLGRPTEAAQALDNARRLGGRLPSPASPDHRQ